MATVYQNLGHLILLLMLLLCSAFFSSSETSFFNLTKRQIKNLKNSDHKFQKLVAKLLKKPDRLLSTLLLGNTIVNISFFAISSTVTVNIQKTAGVTIAAITVTVTFVLLVLFGEILPKSIAYANPRSLSILAAMPLFILVKTLTPIQTFFKLFFVDPAIKLIIGRPKKNIKITVEDFKTVIDSSSKQGYISRDENKLLTEVIQMGFLKVRHVMKPRVDMTLCNIKDSIENTCDLMLKNHLTKIAVYSNKVDNIIGLVRLRDLLLTNETKISSVIKPVKFVPEQKTVESLLQFFRNTATDTAIVVDEYGGLAGSVRLEDIAEEIIGPIENDTDQPIQQISSDQYRLNANLPIHEWLETFNIKSIDNRISTIGGFIIALLGKIPKKGDSVDFENLNFTIESVIKNRIKTLIVTFKPTENDK